MKVTLINPPLCVQSNDPFTTGVVYMPMALAGAGAALRKAGFDVNAIDVFGSSPRKASVRGKFWYFGLPLDRIADMGIAGSLAVVIYANHLTSHAAVCEISGLVKARFPEIPVVILENTQAVTGYSLKHVAAEFYTAGADFILTGEPEERVVRLMAVLQTPGGMTQAVALDGIGGKDFYFPAKEVIHELDLLEFPAWDLFPLENYWALGFAHGPLTAKKYMPVLTSRGCPYVCKFCVIPSTNRLGWRARSAVNVVDELEFWNRKYGITEFHVEDVDPTVSDERTRALCAEILKRGLRVFWKLVSGTKVETLKNETTIDLMAEAGCRYISISPETGSPRVLKLMNKPFNLEHAVKMAKRMSEKGIRIQACFVLGFPGEQDADRAMTQALVHDLTRKGVDEIALFIITPVPGSAISGELTGYSSLSELNFTPIWRKDYKQLVTFRFKLYLLFIIWKMRYYPQRIFGQIVRFMLRRFETKMEMVPFRAMRLKQWSGSAGRSGSSL